MANLKHYRLVCIKWLDASSHDPWIFEEQIKEIEEPMTCFTVGFLLRGPTKKSPTYLVASTTSMPREGYQPSSCCIMKIPDVCVQEIHELEPVF